MRSLRIRLMRHEDIDDRVRLYTDGTVQRNTTHDAALIPAARLRAMHREWLDERWHERRMYRVSTGQDDLVGFTALYDIDWRSRTCHMGIMLVPRYQRRLGLLAAFSMYDYVYDVLNLRVVLHEVMSGVEMMFTGDQVRSLAQATSPDHCYTVGEHRTCYWWSQTKADHEAVRRRNAERGARVRRRLAQGA
ncbi:Protein N-acetyltransferase, RimJ/RimL family [Amycolatopsis xylanica]|uniref:Protein N-acetyltransferase, RimJ/RimL family n=1 Tax=Amycolatopsis xylanica TaxID=589385 RepID=A0A1H2U337_9PSEU|nr:GNAT family N-acetyltransferase [Amycolatopsis xylanica]SDW50420.1 Protein N-acetyltransferase, RimJ/RimL family [Amycolatopsis xylanica]